MNNKPETIDDYLSEVGDDKRQALMDLRNAIREIVPEAVEGFSYGVPAFRFQGHPLVGFGAAKKHCSLYPMSSAVISELKEELRDFETSKGAIRFLPDKPIPNDLLREIVLIRTAQITNPK